MGDAAADISHFCFFQVSTPLELAVIELGIEAALRQQGVVVALLHDVAILHHKDDIGLTDGGQSVGHDKAGAALHHPGKGSLDAHLGAGVDGGGRLVQNQHGGQAEHHAGDAEQLLLALTDVAAVLSNDGIVTLGQAADEAVGVGRFGGGNDLFLSGIGLAVGNVLPARYRHAARSPAAPCRSCRAGRRGSGCGYRFRPPQWSRR